MSTGARVFVARVAGLPVFDPNGDQVGRVRDVVVALRIGRDAPRVLGLAVEGVEVADPGAVTKTLPDFRARWARLLGEPIGAPR